MTERLFTRAFLLVSVANFTSGMAYALFLHFSGYLAGLGASDTQIGFIYGATAVASIAMRPLLGPVMDRYGRRPVILVGNVLNVVFILLYLTVTVLGPWIYAVRIGHGIAEAMLFSALFTYGTDVIPASRRTEGIALFGVSGLLPIGVAGIVGDLVLSLAGFRELFLTAAGFAAVTFVLSLPLPERRPELKAGESPVGFWRIVAMRRLLPIWWMMGSFSTVLTAYFVFIRRFVDDTGIGSVGLFFTAMFDVGTLIGGPILGAIIDTAGWGPMYVTAGVAPGIATVIFWRWDRWATMGKSSKPAAIAVV